MIPRGKANGSPEPQGPETESAARTYSWEGHHQRDEKDEASRSTDRLWVAAGSGPISGMAHTTCRRAMLTSRIQVGWFGGVHEEQAKTASNEDLGVLSSNTPRFGPAGSLLAGSGVGRVGHVMMSATSPYLGR